MKQVVQSTSGGEPRLVEVPRPQIGPTEVLVQTEVSIISAGTERAVTHLAASSLLSKARARPDLVRKVIQKAKDEGVRSTLENVRNRLQSEIPLGYSASGITLEVGEAVAGIRPGQLVATGGAGKANHAEFQAVPGLLCAAVPEGVSPASAAFSTIASIALHGLRLADLSPGAHVVIVGLGLVGQLAARLAQASGYLVAGIDVGAFQTKRAAASGILALEERGAETTAALLEWTRGLGADAVIVTASSPSSDPIRRCPEICRDRGIIVVVGDVALDLERTPLYERELSLRFARSYGPGRYERSYEEWGVDLPPGFVRWSEGRNMTAILDLIAAGRLEVEDLVTHRFGIDQAPAAYRLLSSKEEPYLAIALTYPAEKPHVAPQTPRSRARPGSAAEPGVGLIGAGSFAQATLVPALKNAGFQRFVSVSSAHGLSAARVAASSGFDSIAQSPQEVIEDPGVDLVVIATPHSSHAAFTSAALRAGKNVYCEKPLALTHEELNEVEGALHESGRILFVGFNRRWSPPVATVRSHIAARPGAVVIDYLVNAGPVPEGHWYEDRREGGRLLGEVSHFIDTCSAITGAAPTSVDAVASGPGELLLSDSFSVALSYPGGTLASISYAAHGHPSTSKETIRILGQGHSLTIDDFRQVIVDGERTRLPRQDKGHQRQMEVLRDALSSGAFAAEIFLATSKAALDAAKQITKAR